MSVATFLYLLQCKPKLLTVVMSPIFLESYRIEQSYFGAF